MVAIYARQSIDKKDSISIESQIDKCKGELDGETFEVYKDKGYSGSNINRPAFEKLMEDIKSSKINKVIVYKFDRISRSIIDFMKMVECFKKYKVEFISYSEKIDTSTPTGQLMLTVLMAFAQMERENIQMRIRDNYYARGKIGFYLGGRAPFGYNKIETIHFNKKTYTFQDDPEQAIIVKRLFEMYGNEGKSLGDIAKYLNDSKINTNRVGAWGSVQVGRLIRNPVYVKADADVYLYLKSKGATMNNEVSDYIGENGCYVYGERKSITTSKFTDLTDNFATVALHRGIIEPDIWLKCQYKADGNKQVKNSGKGTHSWLSGIMKCGYCGYAINVVNGYRDVLYINCGGRKLKTCYDRKKVVYIKNIEDIVEQQLLDRLNNFEYGEDQSDNKYTGEINTLKINLVKIDEEINTLLNYMTQMNETAIKYVNDKITELDTKKGGVLLKINNLKSLENRSKISKEDADEYLKNWSSYSLLRRKQVAKMLIDKVIVTDDEIEVIFGA